MAAFGRITAVMGIGQAVGPFLAGTLADATGVVGSGLWISTSAAGCAVAWLVLRPGATERALEKTKVSLSPARPAHPEVEVACDEGFTLS